MREEALESGPSILAGWGRERVFCRPGFAWDFWCGTHSLASHQAVRRSFLKLVSSLISHKFNAELKKYLTD
jgi:hypothetical protein